MSKRNNPGYYIIRDSKRTSDLFKQDEPKKAEVRPLLESYKDMPGNHHDLILLDLHRTFANEEGFIAKNPENTAKLKNILASYAQRNSYIGYCQGMNFLSATIFRVVKDEESIFWVLVNLLESLLPIDYFSQMVEVLVDQKVLSFLLHREMPQLFEHFQNTGVDV